MRFSAVIAVITLVVAVYASGTHGSPCVQRGGQCGHMSLCSDTTTRGLCPGAWDIQCCFGALKNADAPGQQPVQQTEETTSSDVHPIRKWVTETYNTARQNYNHAATWVKKAVHTGVDRFKNWYRSFKGGAALPSCTNQCELKVNTHKDSNDPLKGSYGTGVNLIAYWNKQFPSGGSEPQPVDIVIHYHGFHDAAPDTKFTERARVVSGGVITKRARPTVVLVPRGMRVAGRSYTFPELKRAANVNALIEYALAKIKAAYGYHLTPARRILTAFSGGGPSAMRAIGSGFPADEFHMMDCIYMWPGVLTKWAHARIQADTQALAALPDDQAKHQYMQSRGGALRNFWNSKSGLTTNAQNLPKNVKFPTNHPILSKYYRTEQSTKSHYEIPAQYEPVMLQQGANADVPL